MKPNPFLWQLIPLLLLGSVDGRAEEPVVKAVLSKPNDTLVAKLEPVRLILAIGSESGIGRAAVTVEKGKFPAAVMLQFRYANGRPFTALEGFELESARLQIHGATARPDDFELVFLDAQGKRDPKAAVAGKLAIKVEQAATGLELTLPPNLLSDTGEVKLQWIDFYRN